MIALKTVSLGAVLLALSACGGGEVANLKNLELTGDGGYDTALAREYRDLALYEAEKMGDLRSADRFAVKARAAAGGESPGPEELKRWNLPEASRREIETARDRLLVSLDKPARDRWPGVAARAMARFDCWVEQQEENFQPTHIRACRNGFYKAMFDAENPLPNAFISFFKLDDAIPGGDGVEAAAGAILRAIAGETPDAVRSVGRVRVVIGGYADRSGGPDHNFRLSLKRAENVRDRLIELGVPAGRITVRGHGEAQPLVETPDGVPDSKNRRVEIRIELARRPQNI